MRCPFCRDDNDRVIDSRTSQDAFAIRRRRECLSCKRRYTTYERIDEPVLNVVKRDGTRQSFERSKIKSGLELACWKRPVSDAQIEEVVAAVENDVYGSFEDEVPCQHIGEMAMKHLRELDQVAFVRFASVYRQFKDARDFADEIGPMLDDIRSAPR